MTSSLKVKILTVERNLPRDFHSELAAFRKQFPNFQIEIRTASDFHDRFIVVDSAEFYHVGASIKDAGKRAFMISRIEDETNLVKLKESIITSWNKGKPLE